MSSNAQKTPYARSLNRFAEQKIRGAYEMLGKALPAYVVAVSGSIVTVSFELTSPYTLPNVTCPMFGPEYIRYPTQVGDLGVVIPIDVSIGGIDGLGSGTANLLLLPANLSSLVFFPVASSKWSATDDPQKVVIYGPNGVVIRTTDKSCTLTLSAAGVNINNNLTAMGNTSFGGGAKKVVLDGDPVSGGVVHATSTTIVAT
jgi:hypothetical protein